MLIQFFQGLGSLLKKPRKRAFLKTNQNRFIPQLEQLGERIVPAAPVAGNDSFSVVHDRVLDTGVYGVLDNDWDPDGDSLTIVGNTEPTHGSLTLNADGTFLYTPNLHFVGQDSFTYTISDGVETHTATVTIDVTNVSPEIWNDSFIVVHDRVLDTGVYGVLDNDWDPDGDSLTITGHTEPAHGSLTWNGDGTFLYTPYLHYVGQDSFTYTITDGVETRTATVTIDVTNLTPVTSPESYTISHSGVIAAPEPGILSNDWDYDGDPLEAVLVEGPLHGTLEFFSNGSFTYTADPGYLGQDSFTYRAFDGVSYSDLTVVNLNLALALAAADPFSAAEGDQVTNTLARLLAADGNALPGDFLASIDWGDGTISSGQISDTGLGYFAISGDHTYADDGTYTVSVTAWDQAGSSVGSSLVLTITNVAPTLSPTGPDQINEGEVYTLALAASDPGRDTIESWTVNWGDGTVTLLSGTSSSATHVYAPGPNTFSIVVVAADEDGSNEVNGPTVTVNNLQPALTLELAYEERKIVTLSGQVLDASPGGLTVTFTGQVNATTITNADGTFSLTVEASGLGNIQATVTDNGGLTSDAITVTVASEVPYFVDFYAVAVLGNVWTFRGEIWDEWKEGLVITFQGLTLSGMTTIVQADGTFFITVELPEGESGTVSAQTTDWWGLQSEIAICYCPGS